MTTTTTTKQSLTAAKTMNASQMAKASIAKNKEAIEAQAKKAINFKPPLGEGIHEGCKLVGIELKDIAPDKAHKWYRGANFLFEKDGCTFKKWIGLARTPDVNEVDFPLNNKGKPTNFVWSTMRDVLCALMDVNEIDTYSMQSVSCAFIDNADAFTELLAEMEYTIELKYPANKPYILREETDTGVLYRVYHNVPESKDSKVYVRRMYKIINPVDGKPIPAIQSESFTGAKTALITALASVGYKDSDLQNPVTGVELGRFNPIKATTPAPETVTAFVKDVKDSYAKILANKVGADDNEDEEDAAYDEAVLVDDEDDAGAVLLADDDEPLF